MGPATYRSATLTGVWTVVGALLLDLWEFVQPRNTVGYAVAAAIVGILFFLAPVFAFVIGIEDITTNEPPVSVRFRRVTGRVLCWFLSGGTLTLISGAVARQFGWRL
jgi:hypothetical protein